MIYPHEAYKEIKEEIQRNFFKGYQYEEMEICVFNTPSQVITSYSKFDKITIWPLLDLDKATAVFNQITTDFSSIKKQNLEGKFLCITLKEKLD